MDDKDFLESPVFIGGHRKSGTTLLLNLLDSHPELLTYPADSGFFYGYFPISEIENYSIQQKIDAILSLPVQNLESELNRLSDEDRKDIGFDLDKFKKKICLLNSESDITSKQMLKNLISFYKDFFLVSSSYKKWVEKTTSSEIYASEIFQWFPNAKFIHVIRDPRDNWGSLLSGWDARYRNLNDSKERLLQSLIDRCKLGMEFGKYNQDIFGSKKYLIVKYEDLTQKPEETMKKISSFLEIKYDSILLKPTICGKLWEGNNFEGKKFKSISNVNINRWKERISEKDGMIIEYFFEDIMKYYDYQLEFGLREKVNAAKEHYKWQNYAQNYSFKTVKDIPFYSKNKKQIK
jgi:hypothetical protein